MEPESTMLRADPFEVVPADYPVMFFHSAGYLRIPGLVGQHERAALRAAAERLAGQPHRAQVARSPERTRIDRVVSQAPEFLRLANSPRLLATLRPILGTDIELVENRHNHLSTYHKRSVDRLHRDILQWSRSLLTVLIYLSDCTDLASATRVVPGSHRWPCTGRPNNGGTWLDESPNYSALSAQAVAVPASDGDAVLMHGQLYHCGAGASALGPRIVLTLAYRSVDELSDDEPRHCRLVSGRRSYRGRGAIHV